MYFRDTSITWLNLATTLFHSDLYCCFFFPSLHSQLWCVEQTPVSLHQFVACTQAHDCCLHANQRIQSPTAVYFSMQYPHHKRANRVFTVSFVLQSLALSRTGKTTRAWEKTRSSFCISSANLLHLRLDLMVEDKELFTLKLYWWLHLLMLCILSPLWSVVFCHDWW